MYEVDVLFNGYSNTNLESQTMTANCSCTLLKGMSKIIVDTMTSWDSEKIINALKTNKIKPDDINYVISTHGHSDHIGNNNLFLKAKHIVGFSISHKDLYYFHDFDKGEEYIIDEFVKVIPTPGHTLSDVTVLVTTSNGNVAVTGDLFEKYEDIDNPQLWLKAGSEDPVQQRKNRCKVAELVEWIIPGHGPKFQINETIRQRLREQALDYSPSFICAVKQT